MSLGGPLPRAQSPRAGRVLSRGKDCRATEPPMASRPIRVTPATAAPGYRRRFTFRAWRLRRARRVRRKRGVHTSARTRMNSLRLERVCSPSSASPRCIARRSRSSRSRDMSTGRCLVLGSAFTGRTSELLALRPSTSCRSRHLVLITCPLRPSPASMCDGAAVGALEATRLRRVLHCVPALARSKLRLGASVAAHRISAHAGGGIGLRRDTRKD
jgi:hypothetical protein